jgi:MFS family permease
VFYFAAFLTLISFTIAFKSRTIRNLKNEHKTEARLTLGEILSKLKNSAVILVCLCNLLRMLMAFGMYLTVLPLYLNQVLGLSVRDIGWIISMRIAGMVLFIFVAGSLSDRYGRKPVLVMGNLISGTALFAFSRSESMLFLMFSGLLAGAGDALDMTALMALFTDITTKSARGVMVGLFRTFMDVGGFLGPIIFMLVYTEVNPISTFYLGILLSFVNIFLVTKVNTHVR